MKFTLLFVALTALLLIPQRATAQDDPPSRVARLSYIRGAVSFEPAGTGEWVDAFLNRPLTTGDALWSDQGSRAALHIGSASINLSENTSFSFLNLTDSAAQMQLNSGTLRIRVKWLGDDENFEVDTPNLAFSILRPGIYKISVDPAGYTTVIEDRRGEGEVTGGGSAYNLEAGQVGTFSGSGNLGVDVEDLYSPDDFELWCEQRDHHEDTSISARYVSNFAIGYDDLDDNGGWRPVPDYGMVWFPHSTVVGWAPYHYGHWAYVAPWGYTWVDDAAWGFTPFHYGRWVAVGGSWGWVPCPPRPAVYGAVYVAPVYAPALVAWIGGPHFGIGISIGGGGGGVGVGWFPLGPREVYMPSYPVSRNYVSNVNISNTTVNKTVVNNYYTNVVVNKTVNVTNVTYVNQRVPGAVAATTPQAFSSGQSVARNVVRVDPREVASAPVNAQTPAAVPQRAAALGGGTVSKARPPAAMLARPIVAKTTPPPPPPAFAQRQAAIQSNGGRPLSVAQVRQIAPLRAQTAAAPQIRIAPPSKPAIPAKMAATKTAPAAQPAAAQTTKKGSTPAPAPTAYAPNKQLEQKHEQQDVNLHQQQDQERQKLEQQQNREAALLQQQKAAALKQQQVTQQHQRQLEELQQKHQQEQEQLRQKQEAEHRQAEQKPKPKPKEPPKQPQ
jgi:hypothetical protein